MKVPPQLKQGELVLWFLLQDASKRFFAVVESEMRAFGMTRAQWYLLTHLYYFEGLTQQELADGMDLTKSAAAKLIRKLEQKDWVYRQDDHRDGRVQRVYLVENLKPLVKNLAALATAALGVPLTQLEGDEMPQLTQLLRKVETALDQSPGSSSALIQARARMRKVMGEDLLGSRPGQRAEGKARHRRGTKPE